MKNARKTLAAIAVGVLVFVTNASAVTAPCPNPYIVQEGDNLWSLAQVKLQDPRKWVELKKLNPILNDETRYWNDERGRPMVRIKPLEMLCGLEAAGIKPGDFGSPRPDTLKDVPFPQPVEVTGVRVDPDRRQDYSTPWWMWLLLGLMALAFLASGLMRLRAIREQRKLEAARAIRAANTDPATAGPPMVPGGVNEANVDQALREMAARRYGGAHQDFTILDRTAGRVYGNMLTAYRDDTERLWMMTGQQAYQARIRHSNGHEEVVYMLQACGNDLRFGGVAGYRPGDGFRFIPDAVAETTAQPVAAASAVVEAPAPAAEVEAQSAEVMVPGTFRVEVKPADDRGPNLVQVTGVNPVGTSFKLTPGGFEFRYTNLADQPSDQQKVVK